MALGAVSGSPRTYADDERPREVGQVRSTWEVREQCRHAGGGVDGGKGPGQGKPARAKRVPDTVPDRRAQCARAGTSSSNQGSEGAVHGAPAPQLEPGDAEGGLSSVEASRRAWSRRGDVAELGPGPGKHPSGPVRAAAA